LLVDPAAACCALANDSRVCCCLEQAMKRKNNGKVSISGRTNRFVFFIKGCLAMVNGNFYNYTNEITSTPALNDLVIL